MITIIDYGMGNLRSVAKALEHLGLECEITSDKKKIEHARSVILPGVGAFGDAMDELRRRGLVEPITAYAASSRPLLGICLGMQILMESSEEAPGVAGLGLIRGTVRRFQTNLKVPHMGWNQVRQARPDPIFWDVPDGDYFYFVHSYYVDPAQEEKDVVTGLTDYDITFPSIVSRGNIIATQFHPEKSQQSGLRLLKNFAALGPELAGNAGAIGETLSGVLSGRKLESAPAGGAQGPVA